MREYQIESYISFQSDISDHAREAIDHVDSPDDTLASDKIFSDPGDVTTYSDNCDSLARMHETHFGDSLSDIPQTVIHSSSDIPKTVIFSSAGQDDALMKSLPRTGNGRQGRCSSYQQPQCGWYLAQLDWVHVEVEEMVVERSDKQLVDEMPLRFWELL